MPVRKYHSVEEMDDTSAVDPGDPKLGRIMRDVWEFSSRLAKTSPRRGVRKYRSIEELKRDRITRC